MSKKNKQTNGLGSIRRIIAIQRDLEELAASKDTVKLEVRAKSANRLNRTMTEAIESEQVFKQLAEQLTKEGKKSPMLEAFEAAQSQLWGD